VNRYAGQKLKTLSLTVDGVPVRVPEGTTVLEAAAWPGLHPHALHDDDLEPYGACRLCVVEIENMRGLPTSCTTAAAEGMVVHSETPAVERSRRATVELIMANHPNDCLACAQNQNCELQRVAHYVGVDEATSSGFAGGTGWSPSMTATPRTSGT